MVDRCKRCGARTAKYPIIDDNGKFVWQNLFKMEWLQVLYLISTILMIIGFFTFNNDCLEVSKNPYKFCDGYCKQQQFDKLSRPQPVLSQENIGLILPSNLT